MNRFRGALVALVVLFVVAGIWGGLWMYTSRAEVEHQPGIFAFEKDDLVGILVVRPDTRIELVKKDGEWEVVGGDWRPSRSMVRRVAHQLHDLTARAVVSESSDDLALYGLGTGAITVTLSLRDGSQLSFEAGDPDPASVSWYIRPLPGEAVYIVKKSALDYYRLSIEEFRENRFAVLDADEANRIESEIGGRHMVFRRLDEKRWTMDEPQAWPASRDEVRTMLGRTGALKSFDFVADHPTDLAQYGLEPAHAKITIGIDGGETISLRVGAEIPDTDPPQRYVLRQEDDAVYAARAGFLEAFELPLEKYRNRRIVGHHEWDCSFMEVTSEGKSVRLTRSTDGWRWPDEAPVAGSTPKRLAEAAADLEAKAFHDEAPSAPTTGLEAPKTTIRLGYTAGGESTVTVGNEIDTGEEKRVWARVAGDPVTYEVGHDLASVTEDLFREYGRKVERDEETRVRGEDEPVPVKDEKTP